MEGVKGSGLESGGVRIRRVKVEGWKLGRGRKWRWGEDGARN